LVDQRWPEEIRMPLPAPLEALWSELQSVRSEILKEIEGLSQAQADWRPGHSDWSVGELIHHLTLAEVATGKLTSKLLKEAGDSAAPFPADLPGFVPFPPFPPGPAEAPPAVRPERGHRVDELAGAFRTARERSRQTLERLASVDPRTFKWSHPRFGDLDLAQWWILQVQHDGIHLRQIRDVKTHAGFPK